jgi:hypothetical protein
VQQLHIQASADKLFFTLIFVVRIAGTNVLQAQKQMSSSQCQRMWKPEKFTHITLLHLEARVAAGQVHQGRCWPQAKTRVC